MPKQNVRHPQAKLYIIIKRRLLYGATLYVFAVRSCMEATRVMIMISTNSMSFTFFTDPYLSIFLNLILLMESIELHYTFTI